MPGKAFIQNDCIVVEGVRENIFNPYGEDFSKTTTPMPDGAASMFGEAAMLLVRVSLAT